jgi:hypothetical protein
MMAEIFSRGPIAATVAVPPAFENYTSGVCGSASCLYRSMAGTSHIRVSRSLLQLCIHCACRVLAVQLSR